MDFSSYFPIWNKLTPTQQQILERNAVLRKVDKGTVIHNGTVECTGLLLVKSGQLRAYILSDEGREISLYRLFDRDICLFSASCMMNSIQFEITIEAQKDSTACHTAHNDNFHVIVPPFPHKRKFRLCFSRWYNPSASK